MINDNKEKTKQYNKEYYEQHKQKMIEQINITNNKIVHCEYCNKDLKQACLSAHKKTKIHKVYVEMKTKDNI